MNSLPALANGAMWGKRAYREPRDAFCVRGPRFIDFAAALKSDGICRIIKAEGCILQSFSKHGGAGSDMSGKFLDRLFDFNGDGKTTFNEVWLAKKIWEEVNQTQDDDSDEDDFFGDEDAEDDD